MSQVWPLRTAFKGREDFRLPHYHPRKQRAAVRWLQLRASPSLWLPFHGWAVSPAVGTGGLQEIHPAPWGLSLSAFPSGGGADRQGKEVGHIQPPAWNELNSWGTSVEYRISGASDGHALMLSWQLRTGSPLPGWLVILTASLGQDVHVPNINDHNAWTGWAAQLPQAFTVLVCWEGSVMALLEFAPCFREVRHSWGCSPGVSSRCSAHTLPTPGAHGDREAAQLSEKNQENEFLNFFEEDFSSFCNKIPYKQNYQWTGNSVICHLASSIW